MRSAAFLAALILLAGLGAAVLYWQSAEHAPPEAAGPAGAGAGAGAERQGAAAQPMRADGRPRPERAPPAAAAGTTSDAKSAVEPPRTEAARRLGWSDADAAAVEGWYAQVATVQEQHFNTLEDGGGADAAREFNAKMDGYRAELVEKVGLERANRALREMPIYRFDLASGTVGQVDAQGTRLPFHDTEMEGRWSNFTKRR